MKIAVGSKNPAKVQAVESAISKIWPSAEVLSVIVDHGITDMPTTDEESITGATNRAKAALKTLDVDIGIGIEGGTVDMKNGMFLTGWTIAIDKNGKKGISGGSRLLVPEVLAKEVRKGRELGPVVDEYLNLKNNKQKGGLIGILTNNLIPRKDATEKLVIRALSSFMHPDIYEK